MRPGVSAAAAADRLARSGGSRAGFGLLEAVLALAIAGVVLAAVTEATGLVLTRWSAGFATFARLERADLALARLTRDLDGLLPIPFDEPRNRTTLFVGAADGLTFATVAPLSQSETGIAVVDYRVVPAAGGGSTLVRSFRRPGGDRTERNLLLSSPARIGFAYLDSASRRSDGWRRPGAVPEAVVVVLKGSPSEGGRPVELALPIPARLSVACAAARVQAIAAAPAPAEPPPAAGATSASAGGGGGEGREPSGSEAETTDRPPAPGYCGDSGRPAAPAGDDAGGGGRNG